MQTQLSRIILGLREFNRSSVGLDDSATNALLTSDGLDEEDGIPADILRNYITKQSLVREHQLSVRINE